MSSPDSGDAASVLAAAQESRQRLTAALRLPRAFHAVLALAVAVQIATAGYGIGQQTTAGLLILLGGLAFFLLLALLLLHRFRELNGARIDGLSSQVLLGGGPTASLVYLGAFAGAVWAGFEAQWWLLAVLAVSGGVGYALAARTWWRHYREDPLTRAPGASPRLLAGLAVMALLGLAALLVVG